MENNSLKIQNIISSFELGTKLDLKKLSRKAINSEYNPTRFNGLIMRIRRPRTTALVFSSGKIVCTGAKSEAYSKKASRKFARIIQKLDFDAKFLNFKIQNIVSSIDTKIKVNLKKMSDSLPNCRYEPERFPTLNYRQQKESIVGSNISTNGKVIITGAKTFNEAKSLFSHLLPVLTKFIIE